MATDNAVSLWLEADEGGEAMVVGSCQNSCHQCSWYHNTVMFGIIAEYCTCISLSAHVQEYFGNNRRITQLLIGTSYSDDQIMKIKWSLCKLSSKGRTLQRGNGILSPEAPHSVFFLSTGNVLEMSHNASIVIYVMQLMRFVRLLSFAWFHQLILNKLGRECDDMLVSTPLP